VVLSRCEGTDDHRWWLAPTGRGFFELRGRLKDLCLDPKRRAGKRGARLSMSPCDDYPDQQWSFEAEDGRTRETALASLFASQPRAPFLSVPPIFRLRHGVLWALRRCLEAGRAGGRGGDDPEV
jgi:hypothetical protein